MKVLTGVKALLAAAIAAAGLASFADGGPSVKLNRVQQRYPWNGMVDIDYTVANVPEPANYFVRFTATTKTGVKYVAHEMLDASTLINASNGTYRVTWVASAEGTVFQDCAEFFAKDAKYKAEIVYSGSDKSQIPYPFYVVIDVSGGKDATSYPVAYEYFANTHLATNKYNTAEYKTDKIVLRKIHARTFTMGSPEDEAGREPVDWGNKETQHEVTLTEDYYFGMFPLTQRQWTNVMGSNPSLFYGGAEAPVRPVEQVSYDMIRGTEKGVDVSLLSKGAVDDDSFLGKLRGKSGLTDLDLPTEAQWENAARAGTTTSTFFGNNVASNMKVEEVGKYMWHNGNSRGITHGVGQVIPNQIGLYDVLGNAWEWCLDRVTTAPDDDWGSDPVTDPLRAVADGKVAAHSGAWNEPIVNARSACRGGGNDVTMKQWGSIGFRLAMHAPVRQQPGSVQLWKDGPYFANCNIGATKPEEYGYYFWWGDTVGYTQNVSKTAMVSVADSSKSIEFDRTAPANSNEGQDAAALRENGWIDDDGNLVANHDAATKHWGPSWRMMTAAEQEKLTNEDYCTSVWVDDWNNTGVSGRIFTGKGDYASNSVFFPAAGSVWGHTIYYNYCNSWSSTPYAGDSTKAQYLDFDDKKLIIGNNYRCNGFTVRPVKDAK